MQEPQDGNSREVFQALLENPVFAGLVTMAVAALFGTVILVAVINNRVGSLEANCPKPRDVYTVSDAKELVTKVSTDFERIRESVFDIKLQVADLIRGEVEGAKRVDRRLDDLERRLDALDQSRTARSKESRK